MAHSIAQTWSDLLAKPPMSYVTGFSHAVQGQGQPHRHDSIEIVYHRQGGGRMLAADQTIHFGEGATVITPAMMMHAQRNDGPGEDVCIHLRADRPLPRALHQPMHIARLPCGWLYQEMSALADEGNPAHAVVSSSWNYRVTAVFCQLVAAADQTGDGDERAQEDPRMPMVRAYIAEHYRDSISLAAIARHVRLSPDRLRHLFVEVHGVGITCWVRTFRINRAKDLLENAPFTLAEIARQCGLGTDRYLSQVFRTSTGMTPGEFRRSRLDKVTRRGSRGGGMP